LPVLDTQRGNAQMDISMQGITKHFGSTIVLDNVQFSLASGEVHALMGENGAGKSTLMKILTGVYPKDAGVIRIDGAAVSFTNPKEAEKAGISFVYQELNSLLDMNIEENIFLGRELFGKFGILDKKAMKRQTVQVLEALGVDLNPLMPLALLSVGQRQIVEIAKALLGQAKAIILDEPTAALTETEVEKLFSIIRILREKGVAFVYISHRMDEIFKICDRVTVLRDGTYIDTVSAAETTPDALIRMMIGRPLGNLFQKKNIPFGKTRLAVNSLSKKGMFSDISFEVRAGEIFGIAGLMGAGRSEIMRTIFGSYRADGGRIVIEGKEAPLQHHSPAQAMKLGMAFITEDRKDEGLMLDDSIAWNIDLPNFPSITDLHIFLDRKKEARLTEDAIRNFGIKCTGSTHICGNLSGGNQQKVVFAQWLYTKPKVLLLDEPTRGVDVGAKQEIYSIMTKLAESGVAIVMVSSDLPEVLGMSDRILVVYSGKAAGLLERRDATQDKIMTLATGGAVND